MSREGRTPSGSPSISSTSGEVTPFLDREIMLEQKGAFFLIVDDSSTVRKVVTKTLLGAIKDVTAGHDDLIQLPIHVITAVDVEEAKKLYDKAKEAGKEFLCAIVDYNLPPGATGDYFIRHLCENNFQGKIIGMSGQEKGQDISGADAAKVMLDAGAMCFLVKPISKLEIEQILLKNNLIGAILDSLKSDKRGVVSNCDSEEKIQKEPTQLPLETGIHSHGKLEDIDERWQVPKFHAKSPVASQAGVLSPKARATFVSQVIQKNKHGSTVCIIA